MSKDLGDLSKQLERIVAAHQRTLLQFTGEDVRKMIRYDSIEIFRSFYKYLPSDSKNNVCSNIQNKYALQNIAEYLSQETSDGFYRPYSCSLIDNLDNSAYTELVFEILYRTCLDLARPSSSRLDEAYSLVLIAAYFTGTSYLFHIRNAFSRLLSETLGVDSFSKYVQLMDRTYGTEWRSRISLNRINAKINDLKFHPFYVAPAKKDYIDFLSDYTELCSQFGKTTVNSKQVDSLADALRKMQKQAAENGQSITKEEIKGLVAGLSLNDSQLEQIYKFIAGRGIKVLDVPADISGKTVQHFEVRPLISLIRNASQKTFQPVSLKNGKKVQMVVFSIQEETLKRILKENNVDEKQEEIVLREVENNKIHVISEEKVGSTSFEVEKESEDQKETSNDQELMVEQPSQTEAESKETTVIPATGSTNLNPIFSSIQQKTSINILDDQEIDGFHCYFCEKPGSADKYILVFSEDKTLSDVVGDDEAWKAFSKDLY